MTETTTPPTFAVELPTPERPKGEWEYRAFLRLLPGLLSTHRGKYVAIHNEQVVDRDTDDVAIILRVQKQVGYVPIYVGLVTDFPPVYRGPRYRVQEYVA